MQRIMKLGAVLLIVGCAGSPFRNALGWGDAVRAVWAPTKPALEAYRDDTECRAQAKETQANITTVDFRAMRACLLSRGWVPNADTDAVGVWRTAVADTVEGAPAP